MEMLCLKVNHQVKDAGNMLSVSIKPETINQQQLADNNSLKRMFLRN